MLYQTTCVGLGYGPTRPSLEAFLDSIGTPASPLRAPRQISEFTARGFACAPSYVLGPGLPPPGSGCLPASPRRSPVTRSGHRPTTTHTRRHTRRKAGLVSRASALAVRIGYGNINPLSIDYACRPRLRTRLTLGGTAWPRNPWSIGAADSHRGYRYSCLHSHSPALHRPSQAGFTERGTLPYPTPRQCGTLTRLRRCA
jgi:hypothetical protein